VILSLLAFFGGALTILSPCILPVLPFVFARQGRSFARSTLPLLGGMAVTFAAVATLAAVGGGWAVRLNTYGRMAALALLALFGVTLLSRRAADWVARPFIAAGNRLIQPGTNADSQWASLALGIATGFLWAPCAGPILGLILTGAAINGPSAQTSGLLFAYALGAIASLAAATFAGGRLVRAMKTSLPVTELLRRLLGVAVLVGVAVIAFGWDTGLLTRWSTASTNRIEQRLLDLLGRGSQGGQASSAMMMSNTGSMQGNAMAGAMTAAGSKESESEPPVEGEMPPLSGAVAWLNSPPLTREALHGKVVLIDFWTYSCINCLRSLPYLTAWDARYRDHGLVIIGVHAPEFAFERDLGNVERAVKELGVRYPVAIDNNYAIWRAFGNQYWPAHYFVDASGQIRGHHAGEGDYEDSEQLIRRLLEEAGNHDLPPMEGIQSASGVKAAPDEAQIGSPETYVGYERADNFVSPDPVVHDAPAKYAAPADLRLNQWSLAGQWTVNGESATSAAPNGRIVFRFHARDLHLVLGPASDGRPVRFRVTIDGREPTEDHGIDVDAHGDGRVQEQRLYQLIRQSGPVRDHTFSIEFLDPGVRAYSFTFG
jgi:cytochrome c biogenesis protein CcdA/thiol-disulfide isomerase/thioredoxin